MYNKYVLHTKRFFGDFVCFISQRKYQDNLIAADNVSRCLSTQWI